MRKKRAGRRAALKYRQMRKAWLRRTRRHWVIVGAALASVALAANIALLWLPQQYAWTAGAITGAVLVMWLAAREEPPNYISQWLIGSWGEEQTERVLRPLERAGWHIHHDLASNRGRGDGNLDHVVIGPGGVFLLDSKQLLGEVTVDGDQATIRRIEDPDLSYQYDASKRIIPLAFEVRDRLRAGTRATQFVTPVVVVWGRFPQQVAGGTCTFVHGDHLLQWLQGQPQRVAPARAEQFAAALLPVG